MLLIIIQFLLHLNDSTEYRICTFFNVYEVAQLYGKLVCQTKMAYLTFDQL